MRRFSSSRAIGLHRDRYCSLDPGSAFLRCCSASMLVGFQRAKHHTVLDTDEAPPAHGLDDLGVEELWPWHPARLRVWAFGLAPWRLDPVPIVGEQGRQILPKAIGQKERRTVRR